MRSHVVEVGMKIDTSAGVKLFGADEVNGLIAEGWRVVSLGLGGITLRRVSATADNVTDKSIRGMLAGFSMKIALELDTLLSPPQDSERVPADGKILK
jgi:hypothetical protein